MWLWGRASIDIAVPPERIWLWLVEREKQKRWMGDDVEWLPSDLSQLRAGYVGTEVMQLPQGPSEATVELIEFDPPRRMVVRHEHAIFSTRAVFELDSGGGATKVTSSVRIRYRSLKTWLGVLPIAPFYSRVVKGGLKELKQLVEGEAARSAG